MNKSRSSRNIIRKRILILCEGESEIIYLKGYRSEDNNRRRFLSLRIKFDIYQPKDYSPYGLLTEAKNRISETNKDKLPYHCVWIVFDRDNHPRIPQTFEGARNKVKIAFSLICFEYWILLHFEQTRRYFANCDEIIRYIKDNNYVNYEKTNYYPQVKDKINTALENAQWLHNQNQFELNNGTQPYDLPAYTNFDELYNYLENID